jgi:hypothetical protein
VAARGWEESITVTIMMSLSHSLLSVAIQHSFMVLYSGKTIVARARAITTRERVTLVASKVMMRARERVALARVSKREVPERLTMKLSDKKQLCRLVVYR